MKTDEAFEEWSGSPKWDNDPTPPPYLARQQQPPPPPPRRRSHTIKKPRHQTDKIR